MSTLLSSWSKDVNTVPQKFVFPPEERPGDLPAPLCKGIPVIDLQQSGGHHDRADLLHQIIKASQELGMFQVINHGVSEELMDDTMSLFKEFLDMPEEDKASYCSEDITKSFMLYTGSSNSNLNKKGSGTYWKDSVKHSCHPLEDHIQSWPEKPARYREVVGTYSVEVRKLSLRILDLISEGLGLEEGYFADELSKTQGLIQEEYGLQMYKDEQWVGVEPLPHAFVINIANQLELISNGKLKSAKHRAVTNSSIARTSIVTFISPSRECVIEPAKALVKSGNPQLFKGVQYKEFINTYAGKIKDPKDTTLESYRLQA
ncbi:hypothetical protein TEA_009568 [Camellia sinensis var. sinensis]|uniref:Fe2OG dioxygenase domain-containing protein n=2 Tax=Camellia sinensis TaxID=4442 RepID=A0A4V3WQH6_CAMSN|nr:hypothetical protein TEA_009568 [Camellia sinensis var. sinensis]